MSSFNFLTVQKGKTPIIFLLAWHIAREHYVMARVSFIQGMIYPSCLLAEQSVEMFVKAILHLDHKSKDVHYLPYLLQRRKGKVAYFDKLLNDERLFSFVKSLSLAYSKMRFGEVGFSINVKELCLALDEVVFNLDKLYRETSQSHIVQRVRATLKDGVTTSSYEHPECPLYVPTAMKEAFLRDNKYFGEKDISDNFMAGVPLP
jgi:HEPN domain-containing protein